MISAILSQIPYSMEQGILAQEQGILPAGSEIITG